MAFIATDWSIDRQTGNIRYIGDNHVGASPSYATVIQFHRALQDFADDASYTGNDELDIVDPTPSERSTDNIVTLINGLNVDDTAAEHLYDGSIIQDGGNVIYDGLKILAPIGTQVQFIQNGAVLATDWWNQDGGLNFDSANGVSHNFMMKVRTGGTDIDGRRLIATTRTFGNVYAEFKVNGTTRGINVVALSTGSDLNNGTVVGTVAGWTTITNISEGYNGIDVDNNGSDEFYYSEWNRDTFTINQFYERMKWLTRDGSASTLYGLNGELFRGITHEITVDGGSGTWSAFEAVSWSGGTGQLLARNNATATSCTKLWIQLLTGIAPTDNQVITGGTSAATNTVNVTITERTISNPFCGASTGSSIIGSYGFSLEATDLSATDKVFDLTNTQIAPPNYVTFTVGGVVVSEDSIHVGPLGYRFSYDTEASGPFVVGETLTFTSPAGTAKLVSSIDRGTTGEMVISEPLSGSVPVDNSTITGGTSAATALVNGTPGSYLNLGQFSLNGALTGGAVTAVVINGTIPTDTPSTGTIRILRADGQYSKHAYTSWTGSTFTIASTSFASNNAANGANVYISYIDKVATSTSESFTGVFVSSRNLYVRVRDGGVTPIKTFETTGTLGTNGGSVTAIRTSDA